MYQNPIGTGSNPGSGHTFNLLIYGVLDMKLKCIEASDFPELTEGKTYDKVEVKDPPTETGVCIRLDNGKLFFFHKLSRFEIIT